MHYSPLIFSYSSIFSHENWRFLTLQVREEKLLLLQGGTKLVGRNVPGLFNLIGFVCGVQHPKDILMERVFSGNPDPKPAIFGSNKHEGSFVLGCK